MIEDYIAKNIDHEFIPSLITESFQGIGKVHDWRSYIDKEVRESWKDLTEREKCLLFIVAERLADLENWN